MSDKPKDRSTDSAWYKSLIIVLVGSLSGGAGYLGSKTGPDPRPDPFTGALGRALSADIEELRLDIRDIKTKIATIEKNCAALRSLVRSHNDSAWEWKQRILNCEKSR